MMRLFTIILTDSKEIFLVEVGEAKMSVSGRTREAFTPLTIDRGQYASTGHDDDLLQPFLL